MPGVCPHQRAPRGHQHVGTIQENMAETHTEHRGLAWAKPELARGRLWVV